MTMSALNYPFYHIAQVKVSSMMPIFILLHVALCRIIGGLKKFEEGRFQ